MKWVNFEILENTFELLGNTGQTQFIEIKLYIMYIYILVYLQYFHSMVWVTWVILIGLSRAVMTSEETLGISFNLNRS